MLLNLTKISMFYSMMIGVIITISSNNWISMWMGLEVSMMSFIPIMQNSNNLMSSESMMKYYIIQSVASTIMLMSVISMLIGVSMKNELIFMISMMIKMGLAPFHNWLLTVIEYMKFYSMFIFLTIMKVPPLCLLFQINPNYMTIPLIFSMMISSIACLNQTSVRKIMAFSSIYGISLMLTSIDKIYICVNYLMIYSIMLYMLITIMMQMKMNFMNQIMFNEKSPWIKLNLWINMLSMSGFPLTIGFSIKMMIMQNLIFMNMIFMAMVMLFTSMMVIMFYMRLAFFSLFSFIVFKKWELNYNNSMFYIFSFNMLTTPGSLILTSIM